MRASLVASSTAQSVALARSQLTRLGVLDDPWAASMLRLPWKLADQALRLPVLRRQVTGSTFSYLAARTLFFDDEVKRALDDGVGRVIIVGAGYDSRAWRLARPSVEFIEIDHPATQADKQRRAPGGGHRYVPLDLAADPFPADLTDAEPTIWVVEGVTMYLTREQVGGLLSHLAAPGCRLVANFGIGGGSSSAKRAVRSSASAGGEHFRYEPTMTDAHDLLAETGWTATTAVTGRQLAQRFLAGTAMTIDLTDDAFAITATTSGDQ